jgi:hypothetical protein
MPSRNAGIVGRAQEVTSGASGDRPDIIVGQVRLEPANDMCVVDVLVRHE